MRGEILSYDDVSGTGLISGDDSLRYGFARSAIQAGGVIRPGARVDFVPEGLEATQIMVLAGDPAAAFGAAASSAYVARDTGGGYDFASAMFSFNGRLRRQHFWISWLILFGAGFVTGLIPIIGGLIGLVLIWPNLAISVKRLHDMGKTGWLIAIPWVGSVVAFFAGFAMVIAAAVANGYSEDYYEGNPAAVFALMGPAIGLFAIAGLLGLAFLIWIGVVDSQKGENRFGPNPKGE